MKLLDPGRVCIRKALISFPWRFPEFVICSPHVDCEISSVTHTLTKDVLDTLLDHGYVSGHYSKETRTVISVPRRVLIDLGVGYDADASVS